MKKWKYVELGTLKHKLISVEEELSKKRTQCERLVMKLRKAEKAMKNRCSLCIGNNQPIFCKTSECKIFPFLAEYEKEKKS